jgi:hypothetical protein
MWRPSAGRSWHQQQRHGSACAEFEILIKIEEEEEKVR